VIKGLAAGLTKGSGPRSRFAGLDVIDGKGVQLEELAAGCALGVGDTPWNLRQGSEKLYSSQCWNYHVEVP
jgi:hypothetical protein